MKLITGTSRIRAFAVLRRHSRVRFSPFRRKVYGMAQHFMTYSHICPSTIVFLWFSDTVLVMRLPQAGLACGKRPGEDQLSDVLSLAAKCFPKKTNTRRVAYPLEPNHHLIPFESRQTLWANL